MVKVTVIQGRKQSGFTLGREGLSEGKVIIEEIPEWLEWAKQRCGGRLQGKKKIANKNAMRDQKNRMRQSRKKPGQEEPGGCGKKLRFYSD